MSPVEDPAIGGLGLRIVNSIADWQAGPEGGHVAFMLRRSEPRPSAALTAPRTGQTTR
jgi:hypothetical protein